MTKSKGRSDRLAGKLALVTGLGAGIGRECSLMLARHGARVMSCDINAAAAEEGLELARGEGLDVQCVHPCDLTKPTDVERLMRDTIAHLGGLDILVNAAAWGAFKPIEQLEFENDWHATLYGELDVVFLLTQAAWPHLIARGGGSIINLASANAHTTLRGSPALAHCAGKGGVLAMTRQLAAEGAVHNIRANSISPGLVETSATRPVLSLPGMKDNVLEKMMLRRIGQPEDIAWAAVYFASDESTWVTASELCIDGGATRC